jgi:uncharacterized damage-inducible protein DinB
MKKIIDLYRKELENESEITKKMLSRIPEDKFDWRPHPKSMNLERLSNHLAELPFWVRMCLHQPVLDFADTPYQPTAYITTDELKTFWDKGMEDAVKAFSKADDEMLNEKWTLRTGDQIHWETTKGDALRMSLSQIIHHRAQLGVFLRLLDVPIPGSYGPSADEY